MQDGGEKEPLEATRDTSHNTCLPTGRVDVPKTSMSEIKKKASCSSHECVNVEVDSKKTCATHINKSNHDPLSSWTGQTNTGIVHSVQTNSSSDLSARLSRDEFLMQNSGILVHRSHSAINCRHVRNSSDSSRYSRASADLEVFFSQMGLEKNVLDPMLRQQEAQKKHALFDSVSSLDSPDTRSICSDYAKSDAGLSDIQADTDRSVTPTSAVERNARIIKWLCSVRKAKTFSKSQT